MYNGEEFGLDGEDGEGGPVEGSSLSSGDDDRRSPLRIGGSRIGEPSSGEGSRRRCCFWRWSHSGVDGISVERENREGVGGMRLRLLGLVVPVSDCGEATVGASVAGTDVRPGTAACHRDAAPCSGGDETACSTLDEDGDGLAGGMGCGVDFELRGRASLVCTNEWECPRRLGSRGELGGGGFWYFEVDSCGLYTSPRWTRGRMIVLYRFRHFDAGW